VFERFYAYYRKNPTWGSLHIVLDDGNIYDDHVQFCIDYARERGDVEGAELGEILLRMSRTQRRKLPNLIDREFQARGDRYENQPTFEIIAVR
jgi:hypothetical protein